ncbi:nucleotidyltransferase family protein [Shewanella sp. OMA3-2]|uniref:nucleotidyltransferase family protein n=1 Tax=Shewanella sp. OMA3-2 TaxID=2908650 RepID=UPI001F29E564|nr:nucleotidyltransferase family protein [Shewanella sp. OMA3-2]UJF20453.1 nucleotidyltransferase family protein [Shewanella sp. OMA3-2]
MLKDSNAKPATDKLSTEHFDPIAECCYLAQLAQLNEWFEQDTVRMQALTVCAAVFAKLNITDWAIAAGFVRDFVWDNLHGFPSRELSALNDIDVIYYCEKNITQTQEKHIEQLLFSVMPLKWSVKNQARMHIRNLDPQYHSCLDAMGYWPEKQTAIAVKLNVLKVQPQQPASSNSSSDIGALVFTHAFELACLFNFSLTHNPKRSLTLFQQRVIQKQWLARYPKLILQPSAKK